MPEDAISRTAAAAGAAQKPNLLNVFISYSRQDIAFVDRLQTSLKGRGVEAFVDREQIEKGEEWWARIKQLITEADTIVFVLSPGSVDSKVCHDEVEFAEKLNKRFVPIVARNLEGRNVPVALARLNYIFFIPNPTTSATGYFDEAVDDLVRALETDIPWIREHTRLGVMAQRWEAEGAPRLHVVDLDGAFGGGPVQTPLIQKIARAVSIPVEVGGGLRTMEHVEAVLETGARWAIVGTRAALDPGFLGEVCGRFGDRIIVGLDASGGRVAVDGWTRVLEVEALALARDAAHAGAGTIIYTDIARDGTQGGPNVRSTEAVVRAAGISVFASGGVGSLEDIRQLAAVPGIDGVIVGRALYTGALDLRAALAEAL
jgi:phosphoribosylformimino-5-aminoimidazole carboxamide ribotide isomerase